MNIKESRFTEALYYSKNVTKNDILRIAEEIGLVVKNKRMAKDKLIQEFINQNRFEQLYINFKEFLYIPCWQVADHFNMNTEEIDRLYELGVIKETPKEEQYWNKHLKEYYSINTYPLDVLDNYTSKELKEAYATAYGNKGFNMRIETETKEEADALIQEIDKIFEITREPSYYSRRTHGINTYFTIKKPNNTKLEKARYRVEVDKKDKEIHKLKSEHKEDKERLIKQIGLFMGISNAKLIDIREKSHESYALALENEKLREENEKLKLELEQSRANRKNAGRKAKFTEQEITTMQMYKLQGKTMREIAEIFNCSVATIHKWIGGQQEDDNNN